MSNSLPELKPGDQVLVAYARSYAGRGWSNMLTQVIISNATGRLRREFLQWDQCDYLTRHLCDIECVIGEKFTEAVERVLRGTAPQVEVTPYRPPRQKETS